jgi:hypothetical protein
MHLPVRLKGVAEAFFVIEVSRCVATVVHAKKLGGDRAADSDRHMQLIILIDSHVERSPRL